MKKSSEQFFTLSEDVLFQEVGGELVLLDMASENYFGLDEVGARIWSLLGEGKSLGAVLEILQQEYDVEPDVLERDVSDLLDQLLKSGLVRV